MTISFIVSVCLSTWNNSAPTAWNFMKFGVWVYFEYLSRKLKFYWNLTSIMGTLHEDQYTFFIYLAQIFLGWELFQTQVAEKIKNTHIMFCHFFENSAVYETMWKILQGLAGNRCQYGSCALNAGYLSPQIHTQNV